MREMFYEFKRVVYDTNNENGSKSHRPSKKRSRKIVGMVQDTRKGKK